jgi:hypothetical protein
VTDSGDAAPELRVTGRCLVEDLELGADSIEVKIEDLSHEHPMVDAFVRQRSQLPIGQEAIQRLTSKIVAYSLHSAEHRGLTWHHERAGIVWLLASRFHRSGKSDDAYPYFRELDSKGRLLPDRNDLEALAMLRIPTLARSLIEDVPGLRREAADQPGRIVTGLIGGRIRVRVVVETDERRVQSVAVSMRMVPGEMQVPADWLMTVAAAFFPELEPGHLVVAFDLGGHPAGADEVVFSEARPPAR